MTRKSKFKMVLVSFAVALRGVRGRGSALRWHERNRKQVPVPMPGLYYEHSRLRYA